jgi:hypothetical protein
MSSLTGANGSFNMSAFIFFNSPNNAVFSLVALLFASFKLSCEFFNSPANRSASFLWACFLKVFLAKLVLNVAISAFRSSSNFSLSVSTAFNLSFTMRQCSSFKVSVSLIISQLVIFLFLNAVDGLFLFYFSAKKKKMP